MCDRQCHSVRKGYSSLIGDIVRCEIDVFRETFYGVESVGDIPAARVKRPPLLKQFSIMSSGSTMQHSEAAADKKKASEGGGKG